MNLGDAVLTLTVDDNGLISGFARAKNETEQFTEKTKEQSGNFKQMWDAAFAALSAAGVLMVVEAFKKIIAAADEMLSAFAEDERALVTMTLALASNKNATNDTALALHNWAQAMQESTIFTNDAIERNFVLLSGMGMTEARMKEVMDAAITLASVYGLDLDQAVRGLAMSLEAGTVGMLARQIPTLRMMTKEQLLAGEAINWVAEQYPRGAKIIGDTTAGLQIRMSNLINEQKEKIGEAIADSYSGVQSLAESINAIGTISAVVVGILIKSLLTLAEWFRWSFDMCTGFFILLTQLTIDVARVLWEPLQFSFQIVVQAIKIAFVTALNWILDQAEAIIKKIGEGLSSVTGGLIGKNLINVDLGQIELVVTKIKPIGEALAKIWSDAKEQSTDFFTKITDGAENMASIWTAKTPTIEQSIKKVQTALGGLQTTVDETTVDTEAMTRQWYDAADSQYIIEEALRATTVTGDAYRDAMHRAALSVQQDERDTAKLYLDNNKALEKLRDESLKKEKDRQQLLQGLIIGASKSIFEAIGRDIAAGELSWKSLGTAAIRAIGRIVSAVGDELAASAAADIIKGLAAAASVILAWAAPGYFSSAVIKGIGAAAAWASGAALQTITLAQGGEFTVPQGYPDDSFPMRVQSGETVRVTPAGEAGSDMVHVTVNMDAQPWLDVVTRAIQNRQVLIPASSVVPA